jgi:hypothetical protein
VVGSSVMVMNPDLSALDAAATLAAATGAVRSRRLAEVADLEVLAHWAGLHASDPTDGPYGRHARILGDVLVQVGGEGTPSVQDFSLGEIAIARGTGDTATRNALADVLDLQHRLPRVWRRCVAGEAEVWVARRVAKLSRRLPLDRVGVVDAAIARVIDRESAGRVLEIAEAKIIEADPEAHQARVEAEKQRRYVGLGRTDEYGLRTIIARVEAGDAVYVDAVIARVADILEPSMPDAGVDEVRAVAFGWLARPTELLQLLLEHTTPDPADTDAETDAVLDLGDAVVGDGPGHLTRSLAFPADLLAALKSLDLTPLAPKVVLYVHLHQAALNGTTGVARVEGLGPHTLSQLQSLLGRADVTVKPVLDLSDRVRSTAYEHPEALKERVHLITGGDYWPWATSTSRKVDYDHPTPYQHGEDGRDSPGQTGTHNSGPLGRRHHRWKTHAGYKSRQAGDGRYVWLTPHGLGILVDHTGTRRIDPEHAQMIYDAPQGVDLYPMA